MQLLTSGTLTCQWLDELNYTETTISVGQCSIKPTESLSINVKIFAYMCLFLKNIPTYTQKKSVFELYAGIWVLVASRQNMILQR